MQVSCSNSPHSFVNKTSHYMLPGLQSCYSHPAWTISFSLLLSGCRPPFSPEAFLETPHQCISSLHARLQVAWSPGTCLMDLYLALCLCAWNSVLLGERYLAYTAGGRHELESPSGTSSLLSVCAAPGEKKMAYLPHKFGERIWQHPLRHFLFEEPVAYN